MGTQVILLVALAGLMALVYAVWATSRINAVNVDNERINELSNIIHGGALAFLYREYKALLPFLLVVGALLLWKINTGTAVSFILGGLCSALTGYFGMNVATKANGKTAFSATKGMNQALTVAFTGGTVMGMNVVGIGILGILLCTILFKDPNIVVGFGFGASSIALFARVGGGIYTKAADVGADLVGKVEAGIPEDDPSRPVRPMILSTAKLLNSLRR